MWLLQTAVTKERYSVVFPANGNIGNTLTGTGTGDANQTKPGNERWDGHCEAQKAGTDAAGMRQEDCMRGTLNKWIGWKRKGR